jgi:hypothetical protein
MEKEVEDPGGPVWLAARKKNKKIVPSPEENEARKKQNGGPTSKAARKTSVQRDGGESLSS